MHLINSGGLYEGTSGSLAFLRLLIGHNQETDELQQTISDWFTACQRKQGL
jgi:hypothetical protein